MSKPERSSGGAIVGTIAGLLAAHFFLFGRPLFPLPWRGYAGMWHLVLFWIGNRPTPLTNHAYRWVDLVVAGVLIPGSIVFVCGSWFAREPLRDWTGARVGGFVAACGFAWGLPLAASPANSRSILRIPAPIVAAWDAGIVIWMIVLPLFAAAVVAQWLLARRFRGRTFIGA